MRNTALKDALQRGMEDFMQQISRKWTRMAESGVELQVVLRGNFVGPFERLVYDFKKQLKNVSRQLKRRDNIPTSVTEDNSSGSYALFKFTGVKSPAALESVADEVQEMVYGMGFPLRKVYADKYRLEFQLK
jgi:hypothetical protein